MFFLIGLYEVLMELHSFLGMGFFWLVLIFFRGLFVSKCFFV